MLNRDVAECYMEFPMRMTTTPDNLDAYCAWNILWPEQRKII